MKLSDLVSDEVLASTTRLQRTFAEERRVRVENFFKPSIAEPLAEAIRRSPWFRSTIRPSPGEAAQRLHFASLTPQNGCDRRNCSALCSASQSLLRGAIFEWIQQVTAIPGLHRRDDDVAVLRYAKGDYVRIHADYCLDKRRPVTRRLAVNWSATSGWDPEWGGVLRFFEPTRPQRLTEQPSYSQYVPTVFWPPRFNELQLFEHGPPPRWNVHDVTCVTHDTAERLLLHTFFHTPRRLPDLSRELRG